MGYTSLSSSIPLIGHWGPPPRTTSWLPSGRRRAGLGGGGQIEGDWLSAKKRWSGRWDTNIPEEETTIVNLRKVGDLAEEVVDTLRGNHKANTLVLRLPLPEFRVRFGMRFPVA
jgi:hypothetical protein